MKSSVTINHSWTIPVDQYGWTAYCSHVDTPRGMYDEEIDLIAPQRAGLTEVTRVAQAELDANYKPGMKVRKIVRTWG